MIVAGDYSLVSGTLAKEIFDTLVAQFGAAPSGYEASFEDSRRKASAALAGAIATRVNADMISAGAYTPSTSVIANVSSLTVMWHVYLHMKGETNEIVFVAGAIRPTPSAAGTTQVRITTPPGLGSDLGGNDAKGPVGSAASVFTKGNTSADAATNQVNVYGTATAATAHDQCYVFGYEVK